jgi:hypothetical protein
MDSPQAARSMRWLWGATGLGLVALFVFAAFWDPRLHPGPELCLFHRAAGISCPGCGLTRAAALLGSGRLAESFAAHPLLLPLGAEVALFWWLWGRRIAAGDRRLERWARPAALSTAALLVAVWIVRLVAGTLPQ